MSWPISSSRCSACATSCPAAGSSAPYPPRLSVIGVSHHDRLLPVGPGGDDVGRDCAQFLDAPQVFASRLGQAFVGLDAHRALLPAGELVVDRHAALELL